MNKFSTIIFRGGFSPDRIGGSKKQLSDLGIRIINAGEIDDNSGWDYEFPEIKIRKNKRFDVRMDWNDRHDCCDIVFRNGLTFAYVNDVDFRIV